MKKGCKYGTHRVIEPKGVLPQPARKIDNDMTIYDNEILIDVKALNIDSASFTQLKNANNKNPDAIARNIMEIVNERGKMQNPVTGSGGVLMGRVAQIGPALEGKTDLVVGDDIVTLVSLSLTPLKIDKIGKIHMDIDKVEVTGQAILFESGIYAKMPGDMNENLALAALDVAGAPAQAAKLIRPGDSVLILGASGKSGILCCYEAMKRVGPTGNVVGVASRESSRKQLEDLGVSHKQFIADATQVMDVYHKALEANNGKEYDICINCVNIPDTEMASILPVRDNGTVYFFSMATSFTKAALGAEGVGKDINMIIGNGYTKDHAEITLAELRENKKIRDLFEKIYC
ncbi:MAG TPA: L-erythro-3,5-diaminohexanoate dehydrogenase [Clostridia bacterium]|nr:L-erythro-3,5-diaminohexanoate dehydrogenase [Clostridia bacterium]